DINGTEPITYSWYTDNGVPVPEMSGKTTKVPHPGSYYCVAEDAYGDTAQTKTILVYEADEFRIVGQSEPNAIRDGEQATVAFYLDGGVKPYTVSCWLVDADGNQEDLGDCWGIPENGDDSPYPGTTFYKLDTDTPGTYWFYINDAVGNELETQIEVKYRQLIISEQPKGGTLSINDTYDLSIKIGEGMSPFTYELYQLPLGWENDGFINGDLYDSGNQNTFTVHDEGSYYFIIYDANGRWARSEFAQVKPYELEVSLVGSAQIKNPDDFAKVHVTVQGGTEPYSYEWERYDTSKYEYVSISGAGLYATAEGDLYATAEGDTLEAFSPGWYCCTVTDNNHVSSDIGFQVTYTGSYPKIIVQPHDKHIPYVKGDVSTTLLCEAVNNSEDGSGLTYEWQKKGDYGWETIAYGKELPLQDDGTVEGEISGTYRCVVADTKAGTEVKSDEAEIRVDLVVIRAEQTDASTITFEFDGGKAPYTISAALYAIRWEEDNGDPHGLYARDKMVFEAWDEPFNDTVKQYKIENIGSKIKLKKGEEYYAFFVVRDSLNQSDSVDLIPFVWEP
ncbi:MAG: hypothetical protein IKE43_02145, partial [Coriobacteriales bacterium]|nr:hypothetical protein [Coriobacteriales bacterium]